LVNKSLIKILNARGPKVGPCANPDSMGKGEEDFLKCEKNENLDDK
jgi:hypothetical protein